MAEDFEVRGADEFLRLSKALKEAGRADLRKGLHKAMRDEAKPLVADAKEAALTDLPQSGGLAEHVARIAGFRAQVRTGDSTAGVRITAGKKGYSPRSLNNEGTVRHPVYGNTSNWVEQPVSSAQGWFERAMQKRAPVVAERLEQVIEDTAQEIVREAQR